MCTKCYLRGKTSCPHEKGDGEMQYCDGKPGAKEKEEPGGALFDDTLSRFGRWLAGK